MAGRIPGMSGPLPRAGLVVLAGRCWPAGRSLESPGLDNRLTGGGWLVNLTFLARLIPQKHFSALDTHFYCRPSKPLGIVRLEGLGKLKKNNDLFGTRTLNLLAYCVVPRQTMQLDKHYVK
jgi:hypothetical protein